MVDQQQVQVPVPAEGTVAFPADHVMQELLVPGNGITSVGVAQIQEWLRRHHFPVLPLSWRWEWRVTGKVPNGLVGTFPKRMSKYLADEYDVKLAPEELSAIGNEVARHCDAETTYFFDFTHRLNWHAGDFGDDGSCFWGNRSSSRENMERAGYGAVRFFSSKTIRGGWDGISNGLARAWITPIGITRDNRYPGAVLVFNGYAKKHVALDTRNIGRILSLFWNVPYKWVQIQDRGSASHNLWLNGWRDLNTGGEVAWGMMVGPYETLAPCRLIDLMFSPCTCRRCGNSIAEGEECQGPNQSIICRRCAEEATLHCEHCNVLMWAGDVATIRHDGRILTLCRECYEGYHNLAW